MMQHVAPSASQSAAASVVAARTLAELEQRKRSVSATLRRVQCEQRLDLVEQRREREMQRLQARITKFATRPISEPNTPTRQGRSTAARAQ
jgi:hypothetical protein